MQGSAFWRTLVFSLEALVFILIGFSLRGVLERVGGFEAVLTTMAAPVAGIVAAVLLARFAWVFGSEGLLSLLRRAGLRQARPLGRRQAGVLSWAGCAESSHWRWRSPCRREMPGRDLMLVAAFAVILVTVILQGSTLGRVIDLLKPEDEDPPAKVAMAGAEAAMARAKAAAMEVHAYGPDGTLLHPQLLDDIAAAPRPSSATPTTPHPSSRDQAHYDAVLAAISAARAELVRLHRQGLIEDEVLHDLERDLDLEELGALYQRGE